MTRNHVSEPSGITPDLVNYKSAVSRAFNYYNQEKDKKDARVFLKTYLKTTGGNGKVVDSATDSDISTTYAWVARLITNGNLLDQKHIDGLNQYIVSLAFVKQQEVKVVEEKPARPSVRDYMQDKIAEVLGEFEGAIDDFIHADAELDMYKYLQGNAIPKPYCSSIEKWVTSKLEEFTEVQQTTDKEVKEAYSHIGKRKMTSLIKMLNAFLTDVDRYNQFKKANRKPRKTKVKPPAVQVAKVKYKKEDTLLNIKSVNPADMVGASQVWIYNTKYKRLAAYRTDSSQGIQVKGTTLQNYDPEMSEQRSVRRPEVVLKRVLEVGKVQLRKLLPDLATAEHDLSGRINEECIIVRVIK